jgi:hypothetical protein
MKFKLVLTCALAGALTIPVVADAGTKTQKVTGGGQILLSAEEGQGAGDTITINAQGPAEGPIKGNLTYRNRNGGNGQGDVTLHGTPRCLQVTGNTAKVAGSYRGGGEWQLYIVDNGEGAAAGNDIITFVPLEDDQTTANCDFDSPDEDAQTALGRGNLQVHTASGSKSTRKRSTASTKTVSLAGLR